MNIFSGQKGFRLGKAAVGAVLLGPVGLLGGMLGIKNQSSKPPATLCYNRKRRRLMISDVKLKRDDEKISSIDLKKRRKEEIERRG